MAINAVTYKDRRPDNTHTFHLSTIVFLFFSVGHSSFTLPNRLFLVHVGRLYDFIASSRLD